MNNSLVIVSHGRKSLAVMFTCLKRKNGSCFLCFNFTFFETHGKGPPDFISDAGLSFIFFLVG